MGHRIAKHVLSSADELEHSTYYVLDAQGNVMSVYEREVDAEEESVNFYQAEKHLYGSARLGVLHDSIELLGTVNDNYDMTITNHRIGLVNYELTNHLGNVLSTISDKPIPHDNSGTVDYFLADIRQSTDYSPFGVTLYGRNFTLTGAEKGRFGFNGKEGDGEVKGDGNSYDFGARMYDSRLGRWLTIDPKAGKYPDYSPYHFAYNSPLIVKDPNGEENIVVIGGADVSPTSKDKNKFANTGLLQLQNHIDQDDGELTTVLLYTAGMTQTQLDDVNTHVNDLRKEGKNVSVVQIETTEQMVNYMNSKNINSHQITEARVQDKITNVSLFGHGYADGHNGSSSFEPGHGVYKGEEHDALTFDAEDVMTLNPIAFAEQSTMVYNSCNAATTNSKGESLVKSTSEHIPNLTVSGWYGKTNYGNIYGYTRYFQSDIDPAQNLPTGSYQDPADNTPVGTARKPSFKVKYHNGKKL